MAFIILKSGISIENEEIISSLKELVRKKIAAFAIPTAFLVSQLISRMCHIVMYYSR